MGRPIPPEWSRRIYQVLVDTCGASPREDDLQAFVWALGEEKNVCTEYRFCGKLGFGGKFRNRWESWAVDYYPEDETPERREAIDEANRRLQKMYFECRQAVTEVLFCCDPCDPSAVDSDYSREAESATRLGLLWHLIDLEALVDEGKPQRAVRKVPKSESPRRAAYRGWMLSAEQYRDLYQALLSRGVVLVNDPGQYLFCHHLPENYYSLRNYTPRTIWVEADASTPEVLSALSKFGGSPVILKDYVKSLKHYWAEACFIPDPTDVESVEKTVARFRELRGDVEGGLVFREFMPLEPLGVHPQSGMPLAVEYRLVFFGGKLVCYFPYWMGGHILPDPPVQALASIASRVRSNFFTMDVGKIKGEDRWIVIELGDAQVAGLPDHVGPRRLLGALSGVDS